MGKYDEIKFFKGNREMLEKAEETIKRKNETAAVMRKFLNDNEYKSNSQYDRIVEHVNIVLKNAGAFRIKVRYISSAGNYLASKEITVTQDTIDRLHQDPSLLMDKGEYNKYIREQQKEALSQKQHEYYEQVNSIIDYANTNKDALVVKSDQQQLDTLIGQLFDRTVNSIKKVKTLDSEEWALIGDFMVRLKSEIERIVSANQRILAYYESPDFVKIKQTCEAIDEFSKRVQGIHQ